MRGIIRVAGVALVSTLAMGACGDGGIAGVQKAQALKADNVCIDAQDKVGAVLGDDPAADRDVIRAATDQLKALTPPSQNSNTWELFLQNHNNLWIALDDVAQSLDPNVNDKARAERARVTVKENNDKVIKYAAQYHADECAQGYGRVARR